MSTKDRPSWHQKPDSVQNIKDALDNVQVHPPGFWENELLTSSSLLEGWFAVSTDDASIIAYFADERDALRFRLDLINLWFNG